MKSIFVILSSFFIMINLHAKDLEELVFNCSVNVFKNDISNVKWALLSSKTEIIKAVFAHNSEDKLFQDDSEFFIINKNYHDHIDEQYSLIFKDFLIDKYVASIVQDYDFTIERESLITPSIINGMEVRIENNKYGTDGFIGPKESMKYLTLKDCFDKNSGFLVEDKWCKKYSNLNGRIDFSNIDLQSNVSVRANCHLIRYLRSY